MGRKLGMSISGFVSLGTGTRTMFRVRRNAEIYSNFTQNERNSMSNHFSMWKNAEKRIVYWVSIPRGTKPEIDIPNFRFI
jgi:hypothetical protein